MAANRATLVSVHCQLYDYQRDWLRRNAARGDRNAALRAALDDYIQKHTGEPNGQKQESINSIEGGSQARVEAPASDQSKVSP